MEIRLAENGDLSGWVQLVEPMRHLFPGLETPESMEGYARDIAGAISRQEALCAVGKRNHLRGAGLFPDGK